MGNLILDIQNLRESLESLILLKGINHKEVLKLSQRLDKYIIMYYLEKEFIDDIVEIK